MPADVSPYLGWIVAAVVFAVLLWFLIANGRRLSRVERHQRVIDDHLGIPEQGSGDPYAGAGRQAPGDPYAVAAAAAAPAPPPPAGAAVGPANLDDVYGLLVDGRKIQAIKVYRERTGVGLADAKAAVEAIARQRGLQR